MRKQDEHSYNEGSSPPLKAGGAARTKEGGTLEMLVASDKGSTVMLELMGLRFGKFEVTTFTKEVC